MDNKKIIIGFNILALFILLSTIAYARPVTDAAFDSIRGGLVQVNNFFAGQQYQPYAKAIDFFFFSFLFIAIYMMGARYAFKEIKRPEQVIVILLGLMTAFLLVLANVSAVALLPFIHWIFYVLLFALYWWLLKGIKNGFWRFILALLLTLLTIGLVQGLFNTLTAPQFGTIGAPDASGFGFGNFFKDWGNNFGTIGVPQFTTPGLGGVSDWGKNLFGNVDTTKITDTVTETKTPKETVKITEKTTTTTTPPSSGGATPSDTSQGQGFFGKNWKWLLGLLVLLLALGGGILKRKSIGNGLKKIFERGPKERRSQTTENEENIDDLIREVSEWVAKKLEAIRKIRKIIQEKEALEKNADYLDLYHKKIDDPVFYLDPESPKYKELMRQHKEVTDVLQFERNLEKDLLDLMKVEDELIGRSQMPLFSFQREKFTGRVIEFTSRETQKEWYGKLDYWYSRLKKIEEYVQKEYNARLGIDQGVRNIDPLKRTTGEGNELTLGRSDFYLRQGIPGQPTIDASQLNENQAITQGRPELEMPIGIPDFYGRIFGGLEYSFSILMGDKRGQISRLLNANDRNHVPPAQLSAKSRAALEQFRGQPGLVGKIRGQIIRYYVWTKEEEKIEVIIGTLTHAKELEKWLAKGWATRWHDIRDKQGQKLKKVFSDERKMFYGDKAEPGLFMNLVKQLRHLQHIKALLEALQRQKASMTQMQELYVSKEVQSGDSSKWIDVTSEAKKKTGIALDSHYTVHTRIKEGKGPFKVACYVNGRKIDSIKSIPAKHDEIKFTFEEMGIAQAGEYRISFFAISPGAGIIRYETNQATGEKYPIYEPGSGTYERIDIKKIKIYVVSGTTPPPGTPNKILILRPNPSSVTPADEIKIIGNSHTSVTPLTIGKGAIDAVTNHIRLVDTLTFPTNQNNTQIRIIMARDGRFSFVKWFNRTQLQLLDNAGNIIPRPIIGDGTYTIKINEYEFTAEVRDFAAGDIETAFPIELRLIPKKEPTEKSVSVHILSPRHDPDNRNPIPIGQVIPFEARINLDLGGKKYQYVWMKEVDIKDKLKYKVIKKGSTTVNEVKDTIAARVIGIGEHRATFVLLNVFPNNKEVLKRHLFASAVQFYITERPRPTERKLLPAASDDELVGPKETLKLESLYRELNLLSDEVEDTFEKLKSKEITLSADDINKLLSVQSELIIHEADLALAIGIIRDISNNEKIKGLITTQINKMKGRTVWGAFENYKKKILENQGSRSNQNILIGFIERIYVRILGRLELLREHFQGISILDSKIPPDDGFIHENELFGQEKVLKRAKKKVSYRVFLDAVLEEQKQIKRRVKDSRNKNNPEVKRLLAELDKCVSKSHKNHNWLKKARNIIYDLIGLTGDSRIPVGSRRTRIVEQFIQESGLDPIDFPQEPEDWEREAIEEYKQQQAAVEPAPFNTPFAALGEMRRDMEERTPPPTTPPVTPETPLPGVSIRPRGRISIPPLSTPTPLTPTPEDENAAIERELAQAAEAARAAKRGRKGRSEDIP